MLPVIFVLGERLKQRLLGNELTELHDGALEFIPGRVVGIVDVGFANGDKTMVFDLADAFARDAIFLPDGVKRALLPFEESPKRSDSTLRDRSGKRASRSFEVALGEKDGIKY